MLNRLDNIFKLSFYNTNIKKEILAGFTTFITMSYIIFVNPQIMSSTGMDFGAVFVGTCLAASIACFIMGFYCKLASWFSTRYGFKCIFHIFSSRRDGLFLGNSSRCCFFSGVLFFIMSVTSLRKWMIESIPTNLRIAMASGVGFFIGFIGLKNGGIIIANDSTFLSLGDFSILKHY